LEKYENVKKSTISVYFANHKGSIFTIYHGTPILSCCTVTCKYYKITEIAKTTKIAMITKSRSLWLPRSPWMQRYELILA